MIAIWPDFDSLPLPGRDFVLQELMQRLIVAHEPFW